MSETTTYRGHTAEHRTLAELFTSASGAGTLEPRHWSARRIIIGSALWVVGALILVLVSVAAHAHPRSAFPGDIGVEEWVQQLHQPALIHFVNFASDANWPTPAGIIAVTVIVLLAIFRRFRAAICAAVSGFGADFVNVTLNGMVQRLRPNNTHIHTVAHLGLYSYPSGHVTHVMAFYGFLLYLTFEGMRAHPGWRPWLWIVRVICLYFLVFIGFSRVLEGEHWPSDVLVSYLLGGLLLVVAIVLYHALTLGWLRLRARHAHRTQ